MKKVAVLLTVILYSKALSVRSFKTMTNKVFVYGTLKKGEPNHHWLTKTTNGISKFIAEAKTVNKYPLIIATRYNIPFLLYSPGDGYQVKGEVYEVDALMMNNLDILEDHPNYYVREVDRVLVQNPSTNETETIECWIYFLKTFKKELLSRSMMESYSSKGPHGRPYMERSQRDPSYNHLVEIQDK